MPLYGMASLIFDTFADDEDDPMDDADTIVRTYLGEGPFRGALNYVTGINFASRVGLGELLFRDTFIRLTTRYCTKRSSMLVGRLSVSLRKQSVGLNYSVKVSSIGALRLCLQQRSRTV